MYYAYILESKKVKGKRYIGYTSDLRKRLIHHNNGKCKHTARHTPWKVVVYLGFESEKLARAFERYLKSGSGYAFAKRHFS